MRAYVVNVVGRRIVQRGTIFREDRSSHSVKSMIMIAYFLILGIDNCNGYDVLYVPVEMKNANKSLACTINSITLFRKLIFIYI